MSIKIDDIKNPHNVRQFIINANDFIILFYVINHIIFIIAVIVIKSGIMIKISSYGKYK